MTVWSLACKLESSQNRWFDGSKQSIGLTDKSYYNFKKSTVDPLAIAEDYIKVYFKYVSNTKIGIGSALFNEKMFNESSRKLSDLKDTMLLEDRLEIDLSRQILRFNETIFTVEYFNKEYSVAEIDGINVADDAFLLNQNLQNYNASAIDNALINDIAEKGLTKTLLDTVGDSISFTEYFSARIGGKSFIDLITLNEDIDKNFDNQIGDDGRANPIGVMMFNESMLNEQSENASIITALGLTEDVNIILTTV